MARSNIWKGVISFGLLNIPVQLQSADREKNLHFSMLDGDDFSPIKYRKVNANTGEEVPYSRIVKGFEFKSGKYVVVTPEDFKAANPKATQAIDLEAFIPLDDVDFMFFEKPYYIVPQKQGIKGYFLLRDALMKTRKAAVGKIVIRTKQHLVAIVPHGDYLTLEVLRFAHEILEVDEADYLKEIGAKAHYSPAELKMAQQLIDGMTGKWNPEKWHDTYYDDLMKRIQTKIKKGKTMEIEKPVESEEAVEPTKVVDLLPLLRKSLEKKKTPSKRSRPKRTS